MRMLLSRVLCQGTGSQAPFCTIRGTSERLPMWRLTVNVGADKRIGGEVTTARFIASAMT